ncbi:TetM/TetW/TetO/TetS family tetracycline resistance ribosomal protection protein [Ruminococcus sp. NK3A76]|uniref:translation factor GTPase family protein n=1 Tax=Ruminococcus sp. NK3A76 TaxID=877411 RepID=UPI00048CA5E7|nr:TetM/TetW/TetO/TetS family tetracycline resistance ribosomal protection protein [Ruminococcus sp. NK3A76]
MKHSVIAVLAHVDSGKTTLSEAILYKTGTIRKLGRVDHKDAFLDNDPIERDRGITIFSKQAVFSWEDTSFTLLDTPGHVDFSGETERTLSVIDAAVLVVSAVDGVQSHTRTLWRLLKRYSVPTIVFINKTDMPGADKEFALRSCQAKLSQGCVDMTRPREELLEALSVTSEQLMEEYLETGEMTDEAIKKAVADREVIPCYCGSALKLTGIEKLLDGLSGLVTLPKDSGSFGAKVFKISDDGSGARLTHMRITGGTLSVRDTVTYTDKEGNELCEKISRIRIYNGEKYTNTETAVSGQVCAVIGLSACSVGQALGEADDGFAPMLEPVLTYAVIPPKGVDDHVMLHTLKALEDEDPSLNAGYDEQTRQLFVSLMGEVQLEVLKRRISERFGIDAQFGEGRIAYRETIKAPVKGAGHFEPLRHYAEVHLRLEPLPRGSGLVFDSECSTDQLARNWQRLILTHLKERIHKGVLTRSPITDMKITLTAGRAHLKHTEGGDFRQATYRAVRQGLRYAESVLLEPYYTFRLEIPSSDVGRALTDIDNFGGVCDPPETVGDEAVIQGRAPVAALRFYHTEVAAYTKGLGRLFTNADGYDICKNPDEVTERIGYDPDSDTVNTADSVFCSHGAGHSVPWDEANDYMHIKDEPEKSLDEQAYETQTKAQSFVRRAAADEELMQIFERTYGKIDRKNEQKMRTPKEPPRSDNKKPRPLPKGPLYILVDGYNIIYSWERLKKLCDKSLDLARSELINIMANYRGFMQCELIVVFDAYRVKGDHREVEQHSGISVVYTKEAETADTYIERTAHKLSKEHRVRVATSDRLEQVIILGSGAMRVSAHEFELEVEAAEKAVREIIDDLR